MSFFFQTQQNVLLPQAIGKQPIAPKRRVYKHPKSHKPINILAPLDKASRSKSGRRYRYSLYPKASKGRRTQRFMDHLGGDRKQWMAYDKDGNVRQVMASTPSINRFSSPINMMSGRVSMLPATGSSLPITRTFDQNNTAAINHQTALIRARSDSISPKDEKTVSTPVQVLGIGRGGGGNPVLRTINESSISSDALEDDDDDESIRSGLHPVSLPMHQSSQIKRVLEKSTNSIESASGDNRPPIDQLDDEDDDAAAQDIDNDEDAQEIDYLALADYTLQNAKITKKELENTSYGIVADDKRTIVFFDENDDLLGWDYASQFHTEVYRNQLVWFNRSHDNDDEVQEMNYEEDDDDDIVPSHNDWKNVEDVEKEEEEEQQQISTTTYPTRNQEIPDKVTKLQNKLEELRSIRRKFDRTINRKGIGADGLKKDQRKKANEDAEISKQLTEWGYPPEPY